MKSGVDAKPLSTKFSLLIHIVKSTVKISSIFMALLENMNFIYLSKINGILAEVFLALEIFELGHILTTPCIKSKTVEKLKIS